METKGISHFTLNVRQPYFSQIADGQKTLEGRLYRGRYKHILPGDILEFVNGENPHDSHPLRTIVINSFVCTDLIHGLRDEKFKKAIPNSVSIYDAAEQYYRIYSQKEIGAIGMVFFNIQIIKD